MFNKFRDIAYINKVIKKQRKMCEQSPESGYSAVIAYMLQEEANGTFKHYPVHTHKTINNFFVECVNKFRQTNWVISNAKLHNKEVSEITDQTLMLSAVTAQAIWSNDMTADQVLDNVENTVKILVNIKLLPERVLDDSQMEVRVV